MRSQRCRWPVVALVGVSAIFSLQACGGSSSSGQTSVRAVPSLISISPTSVAAGATGFTLTVVGSNYRSDSVVRWNDNALATTYVSATQLTATVPASRLAAGGGVFITVLNPGNDGGRSTSVSFDVLNPAPLVTGIAPSQIPARSIGFPLSVNGSGFTSVSLVRWNGVALSTTYVSGSQLAANVPAEALVWVGNASVTVVNPSPGGGSSTALVFTIGPAPAGGPNHITNLNMVATGMVWDASRGRIYAVLPATSVNGNSVVAIDPLTGTATAPVSVGSDPRRLALSADASHLWVSIDGANAIQRLTLPDLTPDLRIDLPPDALRGPQVAFAMQPAPVNPDMLAVVIGSPQTSSSASGAVAIFDGGIQRPTTTSGSFTLERTSLQWARMTARCMATRTTFTC